jgi:hypothetical protein
MGMYLGLAAVSETTIARLHEDPALLWQIIAPDDPEAVTRARPPLRRPGLLARLFGRGDATDTAPPAPPAPLVLAEGEGEIGELDKAWHGLHYLLTGTAWEGEPPLDFLLAGGSKLDNWDADSIQAHTLTPAETRAAADALRETSDDALRARWAPAEMMRLEIYPEIWDRDPAEDDTLGWLLAHAAGLRVALDTAVRQGHGLLVTVG